MTIDKAIEILAAAAFDHSVTFGPDFYDALKLGIEALHRLQEQRTVWVCRGARLLPGETEE